MHCSDIVCNSAHNYGCVFDGSVAGTAYWVLKFTMRKALFGSLVESDTRMIALL